MLSQLPWVPSSSTLSAGAYAGIGIAAFAAVIIVAAAIWLILRWRRRRHRLQSRYDSPILPAGVVHSVKNVAPPSPFLSGQANHLSNTTSGGNQSPVLVYERHHDLPSTLNKKGDGPVGYAPRQVPEIQLSGSPVTISAGTTTTGQALPVVSSPPPAYGNGIGGRPSHS